MKEIEQAAGIPVRLRFISADDLLTNIFLSRRSSSLDQPMPWICLPSAALLGGTLEHWREELIAQLSAALDRPFQELGYSDYNFSKDNSSIIFTGKLQY